MKCICHHVHTFSKKYDAKKLTLSCHTLRSCFHSNHLYHLPLVLVFGIATAVTTVHRLLPSGVSSLMCIEKFQSPPSSDYLTRVVQKVRGTTMLEIMWTRFIVTSCQGSHWWSVNISVNPGYIRITMPGNWILKVLCIAFKVQYECHHVCL